MCELRYRDSIAENQRLRNRATELEELSEKQADNIERLELESDASAQREQDLRQRLDESVQDLGNEAIGHREDHALMEGMIEGAGAASDSKLDPQW